VMTLWVCAAPCLAGDADSDPTPVRRRLGIDLSAPPADTQALVRRAESIRHLRALADVPPLRVHGRRPASRDFLRFMVRHAQRSSSWEFDRLQTSDLQEIESRQDEMSRAAEKIFTRHRAEIRAISGVYRSEAGDISDDVGSVIQMAAAFEKTDGRRPRVMLACVLDVATTTRSSICPTDS